MNHRMTLLIGLWLLSARLPMAASTQGQSVSPEELFRQAQAASHENDYAQAEKLYRQVLQQRPDHPS